MPRPWAQSANLLRVRKPLKLHTRRLKLRPMHWGDLRCACAMDAEPEMLDWVGGWDRGYGGQYPSPKSIYRPYRNRLVCPGHRLPWFGFWGAFDRRNGAFLGWFQFEASGHQTDQAVIGWRFRRAYWGRGLASEGAAHLIAVAFRQWGIRRVVADAVVGHRASRRVMEKAGLRFHRLVKDHQWGLTVFYALGRWQTRVSGHRAWSGVKTRSASAQK